MKTISVSLHPTLSGRSLSPLLKGWSAYATVLDRVPRIRPELVEGSCVRLRTAISHGINPWGGQNYAAESEDHYENDTEVPGEIFETHTFHHKARASRCEEPNRGDTYQRHPKENVPTSLVVHERQYSPILFGSFPVCTDTPLVSFNQ